MSNLENKYNVKITDINFSVSEEVEQEKDGEGKIIFPPTKKYNVLAHVTFTYDSLLKETKTNGLSVPVGTFAIVEYDEQGNISGEVTIDRECIEEYSDKVLPKIETAIYTKVESLLKEDSTYATVNSMLNEINLLEVPHNYESKTGLALVTGK